ncbi:MAG TPA: ribbon-helix-helix protein, CopG family [Lamprocystis sp. (in: g-proteobacteria)]|nr:ribbon-helix-helix protein, CopG family [Lamprocystis sp. (in: g-proteobacteria)]
MVALSIELPEELAAASLDVARGLGLSRSELIRRALEPEIGPARAAAERRTMAKDLLAMACDPVAHRFAQDLDAAD